MTHPARCGLVVTVLMAVANGWLPLAGAEASSPSVRASTSGASLNSDLMQGGGTDDTAVLQGLLNRAASGKAIHVIIDGPALVSGLVVYSQTTIECTEGGGLYLRDHSDGAVLRNAHRSRTQIRDQHITVRGCFINGNREHQTAPGLPAYGRDFVRKPDGTWKSGIQFLGVAHLSIENVTLIKPRSFASWVANAKFVSFRNITVKAGIPPAPEGADLNEFRRYRNEYYTNNDGLHFTGPIQYLNIDGARLTTTDDAIALNANDMVDEDQVGDQGPFVGQGPITDVNIRNVVLDRPSHGFRFLSSDQRIDRVFISGLSGTVMERMVVMSPFVSERARGNIGAITFEKVDVQAVLSPTLSELYGDLQLRTPAKWIEFWAEEGTSPIFSLNGSIEQLTLKAVSVRAVDDRPIVRLGARADIDQLSMDLRTDERTFSKPPLEWHAGARVKNLHFSLSSR